MFDSVDNIEKELVESYFKKYKEKKRLEEELGELKKLILERLEAYHTQAKDFGHFRAKYSTSNLSHFDDDKLEDFLRSKGLFDVASKQVVDEDKVASLIEAGKLDVEEVKKAAWVEKFSAPKLAVKDLEE